MKIYFAGSIRGGRNDAELYLEIISYLNTFGEVLTEHIGDTSLTANGEILPSDQSIHDRDMKWLLGSDIIVAEVTNPSLGVGYEIGRAIENKKRIICIYRQQKDKQLSAMIAGSKDLTCKLYNDIDDLKKILKKYLK